jgi:isoleucyl-tRNA synthetase
MSLLFSTVQRLMSPEIPHSSAESWISLLLTTSTMERIVSFFVSVAKDGQGKNHHDSTWSHRKEFLLRMREDLNGYIASVSDHGKHVNNELELNHVWFRAASHEMDRRGAIPHTVEDTEVHILHGSVVKLGCESCYDCYDELL